MEIRILKSKKGMALVGVIIFTLIFTILSFSTLHLAGTEAISTRKEINKTKAFYLAEAGISRLTTKLFNQDAPNESFFSQFRDEDFENIEDTLLGDGSYRVDVYYDKDPPYAISSGKVGTEEKSIKVEMAFLVRPYEEAVYAGNLSGSEFTFTLRGQGDPKALSGGKERGGKDIVNGNIFANGDVSLYEESSINPAPLPNTDELNGDVEATGNINIFDSASISGKTQGGADSPDAPDLLGMNYQTNNTHDVSQLFAGQGITGGRLPSGSELYNVLVKNPVNRKAEYKSTDGDDYFFEPAVVTGGGDKKSATTPLHLGEDRIYYVDGNVWIHSLSTYGFLLDGKATIVATGNIHICDNTAYAGSESLLGLVSLGKYDPGGQIVSGGNIYFGDPRYGTMYTVSGLMFAANDFLYNTDSVTKEAGEPETGFSVYGNLTGLNHVSIKRDWYDDDATKDPRPAHFDPSTSQWIDVENGLALTSAEISSLRHYQMKVDYDDRVRDIDTQPSGLPKGAGVIFCGLKGWKEL